MYIHKTIADNSIKFQNAEQLWFWFTYSRSVRNSFSMIPRKAPSKRVCELVDVETMITKLYLSGKLKDEHLMVMKEFGDKKRAPHQHIYHENKKARLWKEAMREIQKEALDKCWLN